MAKQIYLIRHGESTFNEWRRRSLLNFTWICVRDPMIVDAPLSKRGKVQVEKLHQQLKDKDLLGKIELVISSPLTRALDTAIGAFGPSREIIVDSRIRERLDTCCDIGRNPSQLETEYANTGVIFGALESNWWYHDDFKDDRSAQSRVPKESYGSLDRRIASFVQYLQCRQETHIAIVGHSKFLKRLLMTRTKLKNCQLKIVNYEEHKGFTF